MLKWLWMEWNDVLDLFQNNEGERRSLEWGSLAEQAAVEEDHGIHGTFAA